MFFIYRLLSQKITFLLSFILLVAAGTVSCSGNIDNYRYIGFFPGEGIKGYDGSWHDMSEGLPEKFNAEYITSDSEGSLYLTTEYSGIFRLEKGESLWKDISSQVLKRRTQLEGVNEYRQVSAFCIDPADNSKLYLATKHTLYKSADGGKNWQKINVAENRNSYYFTSLTIADGILYAGTSFNGVVKITPSTTTEINEGIPKEYYVGPFHFCEEVSSLAAYKGMLYSGYLFGRGLVESSDWKNWKPVKIPVKDEKREGIHCISPFNDRIFISTTESIYEYNPALKKIEVSPLEKEVSGSYKKEGPALLFVKGSSSNPPLFIKRNITGYRAEKESKSGNRQALYVNWGMINANFKGFLDIVERNGFNAVVIDVKDDFGIINAPVESKTAEKLGAIRNTNIKDIIKQLHDKGIYVIARNVTFKDKKMYEAYNGKYAIWDKFSNKPWVGLPREKWCDPYSKFVR
ncbi:MAG TPA: putative glycoside hydrolase, partial [Spirochaetota bacterium]|nr:putative glycoside hydrolase [Spirochaetota bacterium]HPR38563.1 putative glycoside hydrolase [Spirochaetota bacterium]